MAGWRRVIELTTNRGKMERLTALSRSRTEPARPGIAGTDAAGLSRESFVLCGGAKSWGPSSDGSALRGAGAGLWAAGSDRGSTTAGQRTSHHTGGQAWLVSLACDKAKEHGYPHELWTRGCWPRQRPRALDDGGARMSRQAGPRHGVQDTRPGGNQTDKVRYYLERRDAEFEQKMAEVSVRLPRGPGSEKSRCQVAQSHQASGNRFLR